MGTGSFPESHGKNRSSYFEYVSNELYFMYYEIIKINRKEFMNYNILQLRK